MGHYLQRLLDCRERPIKAVQNRLGWEGETVMIDKKIQEWQKPLKD